MELVVFVLLSLLCLPLRALARGSASPDLDSLPSTSSVSHSGGTFRRHLEEKEPPITDELVHGYMSNTELANAMKELNKRCSNITRVYSIGRSVKGFPLWVMEMSDKPGVEEPEPAFKFIGNVHGDEPVGRELLMLLANWLCDNYMKDSLATLIVRKVHLHLLPTMNPDGFDLRKRGNANQVDLNRDFPDQFHHLNDEINSRQPETRAIMNWVKYTHFTASASLHGGALVANYPWDGSNDGRKQYYACPDDKAFRYMARLYSHSHYNMSLSKEFEDGITNGALWYPIYGGMQDWNYINGGCFELTLEVSDVKWPKATELPVLWEYNRKSMLNLVASLVKGGVHGRIFSSNTGHPLQASVVIKGIDYTVNASQIFGDYHRILPPGASYEVVATMPGFETKSTRILLEDNKVVKLDFILDQEEGKTNAQITNSFPCNCDIMEKLELLEYFKGYHLELCLVFSSIVLFLCFLYKRKTLWKLLNRKQHRRPLV